MRSFNFLLVISFGSILFIQPIRTPAQTFIPVKTFPKQLVNSEVEKEPFISTSAYHPLSAEEGSYEVDEITAKKMALRFITSGLNRPELKSTIDLELSYKSTDAITGLKSSPRNRNEGACYYIFSSDMANSYVIISGDKRAIPVLGYSTSGTFDPENAPPNMLNWLNFYENQIRYVRINKPGTVRDIQDRWQELNDGKIKISEPVVAPLLKTRWAQSPYFNDMCPYIDGVGERAKTGCTAIAMAQIMKYWNYPERGEGSHSYIPESYPELGEISVNFAEAEYDWEKMPDTLNSPNPEVAELIFHCGVSTNMDYREDVSWASINEYNHPSALLAFINHFGYKQACKFERRRNYSANEWLALVISDLNAGRPVLYAGGGEDLKNAGHIFVCDGYDSNYYLHFNFGWRGTSDGYFSTNAVNYLNIFDFTKNQEALINLEPRTHNPEADVRTFSKMQISPSNHLKYNEAFTLKSRFKNFGEIVFNGSVLATIWDSDGKFFGYFDVPKPVELSPGMSTDVMTFSTEGVPTMTAGEYTLAFVAIFSSEKTEFIYNTKDDSLVYNSSIKIKVLNNNEEIAADEFEENNLEINAVELTPTFLNNEASLKITPNIHKIDDIDYFKIELPAGYNYRISSLMTDYQTNTSFIFDGKYSYKSGDGSGSWSRPEDIDIADFRMSGEDRYVYFKVEPFISGFMGDYELAIDITREGENPTSLAEAAKGSLKIYPIPNDGGFTLELGDDFIGENEITICDLNGKIISKMQVYNSGRIFRQYDLHLSPGIYFLHIRNNGKYDVGKMVVY